MTRMGAAVSAELTELLFENWPEPVFILSPTGAILACNQAARPLNPDAQNPPESLNLSDWLASGGPELQQALATALPAAVPPVLLLTFRIFGHALEGRLTPLASDDLRYLLSCRLQRSFEAQDDLNHFFELSSDLLCLMSIEGYFRKTNRAFAALLGYTPEELLAMPIAELIHPDDREFSAQEIQQLLSKNATLKLENRYRRRDGSYVWIAWTSSSISAEGLLYAIGRDITLEKQMHLELKDTTRRLAEALQRYEIISRTTKDLIWDWHIAEGELSWNQALAEVFGYPETDAESSHEWRLEHIHPQDQQRVSDSLQDALSEGREHWEAEYRFACSDGSWRYVLDRGSVLYEQGKPVRMLGAMQDMSNRRRYESALERFNDELHQQATQLASSNRDLERFAYIASHDLQEPLRMVSSFLQLLKRRYESQLDETAHKYIHFAVDGAERMKILIEDLLAYSRISNNAEDPKPVALKQALEQALQLMRVQIDESQAEIHMGELPMVSGHASQLSQLFQNLVGNAIKYHHAERPVRIKIGSQRVGKQWQIFVQDNGIGIEDTFFEKIFIIFQRLHNKSEYSGTGIGLAICKKIVERHGGKMWVESRPDEGSCFWFALPAMTGTGSDTVTDSGKEGGH